MSRTVRFVAAVLAVASCPKSASAQTSADADTPIAVAKQGQAKERYLRALELYQDGLYDAALLEFRKAYEIAPTYKLFYNLAVCAQRMNDFAEAHRYYERYLAEGKEDLSPERVAFVKSQLQVLATRIGHLVIRVNVPNAEITIDDAASTEPAGEPILVNIGRRKVAVSAPGRLPASRTVLIGGGDSVVAQFDLMIPIANTERAESPEAHRPPAVSGPPIWPFWTATAALGVAAGAFTVKAFASKSQFDDAENRAGVAQQEIDAAASAGRRDAAIADVLWGATAVAGGIAVFVTVLATSKAHKIAASMAPRPPRALPTWITF